MKILAIETSCDDTCVSVVNVKYQISNVKCFEIVSNVVSSQVKIHAKYGGVYPALAKREHQRNLPLILKKAIKKAGLAISKIDLIAVTIGPGLEPCLWTGINFAKELAKKLKVPIIPVNHIEAHIIANFIRFPHTKIWRGGKFFNFQKVFPAICLVVSGGHTQLILMKNIGRYKILGETRDDAAGECLDKCARILELPYPGGPAIAQLAGRKFKISNPKFKIKLPRPMIYQKNYDFSFSGLKTAVLYLYQKLKIKNLKFKQAIAEEIQQAIIDVLIYKTLRAVKEYQAKAIILGGGVVANKELRKQFQERLKEKIPHPLFLIPDSKLCTDNAAMIAITGYYHWLKKKIKNGEEIKANANLRL